MTRVVCLSRVWAVELEALQGMLPPGVRYSAVDMDDTASRDEAIASADVLISSVFTREMAQHCRSLALLLCPAAGTENIDRTALPPHVRLENGVGHEIAIAEYVLGALIALRRNFSSMDAGMRRAEWRGGFAGPGGVCEELYGSRLGLVGYGRIGARVHKLAAAFEMRCAAVTLHPARSRSAAPALDTIGNLSQAADVDALVGWADAVVICCELSPVTQGLMDRRRFGLMKESALFVNVARGAIAVEADLYEALRDRRIAGAAIDVWYNYPERSGENAAPSALDFNQLDNVLMTPHCSGWTRGFKARRLAWLANAIADFGLERRREA